MATASLPASDEPLEDRIQLFRNGTDGALVEAEPSYTGRAEAAEVLQTRMEQTAIARLALSPETKKSGERPRRKRRRYTENKPSSVWGVEWSGNSTGSWTARHMSADGARITLGTLKAAQWAEWRKLPVEQRRPLVEQWIAARRAEKGLTEVVSYRKKRRAELAQQQQSQS